MEDKQLNSTESIALIQRMIEATREKYERGGGTIFLIWGYVTLINTALILTLLHFFNDLNIYWLWWGIPVVGWSLMYFYLRKREKPARTYIDKFIGNVWYVIGGFAMLFPVLGVLTDISWYYVIPIEALLLCAGVIITGLTIKVRAVTVGGILAALSSVAMFTDFSDTYDLYFIFFMLNFVFGMIIPGHILNYRGKRCSKN